MSNTAKKLREKIINAEDMTSVIHPVPEWGVEVEIRSLTAGERAELLEGFTDADTGQMDVKSLYAELVLRCTFDPESGDKVFDPSDAEILMRKNGAVVEGIAVVASELNGISEKSKDEAGKS